MKGWFIKLSNKIAIVIGERVGQRVVRRNGKICLRTHLPMGKSFTDG